MTQVCISDDSENVTRVKNVLISLESLDSDWKPLPNALPEELPGAGPELLVEEAVDDDVEGAVGNQQEAVHAGHHLQERKW